MRSNQQTKKKLSLLSFFWKGLGGGLLLIALAGCPGDVANGDRIGVATNFTINGLSLGRSCSATYDDYNRTLRVTINEGKYAYIQIKHDFAGDCNCRKKEASVVLWVDSDKDPHFYEFVSKDYVAGQFSQYAEEDCQLSIGNIAANRIAGHFQGHLSRRYLDGIRDEYVDISFDFDVKY